MKRIVLAVITSCLISFTVSFPAFAGTVYYGCVSKNSGVMQIVSSSGACREDQYVISWNQQEAIKTADQQSLKDLLVRQDRPGLNESRLRAGTVDPVSMLGNNGDFYINLNSNKLFGPKNGYEWPTAGSIIIGPQDYIY